MIGDEALVAAILKDFESAPIPPKDKALFAFIKKINDHSTAITQADVDALTATGWCDEAVYDAITVCSLFRFYNAWVDACGGQGMTEPMYARAGKRLAERGYARGTTETPPSRGRATG